MRRLAVVLVLAFGCDTTPAEPPASPAEVAMPEVAAPSPAEEPVPEDDAPAIPEPLCVRMCTLHAQARAVGPEVIQRDCERGCDTRPHPDCKAGASEARARVEAVPMRERAANGANPRRAAD